MTAPLVIVIPSRGRPQAIAELHQAFAATTSGCSEIVVALDLDDPTAQDYPRHLEGLRYTVGHRHGFAPRLSHEAIKEARTAVAIGSWGDDHRPRTRGWDDQILQALEDLGTGVAYGDDLYQGARLPTAAHLTSDIIQTLGWMTPPTLAHMYVDNFWLDMGREIGRIAYLPDVVIEHMHPAAGKGEWDELVREANTTAAVEADRRAYNEYRRTLWPGDLAKLRDLVGPPPSVDVIVPFRGDDGPRSRAWAFCRARWEAEGFNVIIADDDGEAFSRAASINLAAKQSTADVLVVADADTTVDATQVRHAVALASQAPGMVIAFERWCHLTQEGTEEVLSGHAGWWGQFMDFDLTGTCSSCIAISREGFNEVGGFPEVFRGWGMEDVAFNLVCSTLLGETRRVQGDAWHLWHPSEPHRPIENEEHLKAFADAAGDPEAMRALCS